MLKFSGYSRFISGLSQKAFGVVSQVASTLSSSSSTPVTNTPEARDIYTTAAKPLCIINVAGASSSLPQRERRKTSHGGTGGLTLHGGALALQHFDDPFAIMKAPSGSSTRDQRRPGENLPHAHAGDVLLIRH